MTAGEDTTELGRALRKARIAAELRQDDVVARIGISQTQLSRIERGTALPNAQQAADLTRLYELDEVEAGRIRQLVTDARARIRDTRLVVQRGSTLAMQQRWRELEGQARTVRAYHPAVVLGVLQTSAYAAIALREPVDSPVVRDRMLRHERLLSEPQRQHLLIQSEGALQQVVGSPEVMAAQLDRIISAAAAPNIEVAVIPAGRPLEVLAGSGFHLYDDTAVVIGLEVAAATLTDPQDVTHFRRLWDQLWSAAAVGDDAVALIRKAMTRLYRR